MNELEKEVEEKPQKKDKKKSFWQRAFNHKKIKNDPRQVAVIYLRNNGTAVPMEVTVKKGFFSIEGRTYHEQQDCIYAMGKDRTPLAIIPEWSMIPYGTKTWHDKTMLEKFSECQDHHLRAIRNAELVRSGERDGPKINPKVLIGLLVLAIIGFAIFKNFA